MRDKQKNILYYSLKLFRYFNLLQSSTVFVFYWFTGSSTESLLFNVFRIAVG